jgi:hypothetical protein
VGFPCGFKSRLDTKEPCAARVPRYESRNPCFLILVLIVQLSRLTAGGTLHLSFTDETARLH